MTYDIVGNIAIIKFEDGRDATRGKKLAEKKKVAKTIIERHKNISTVLEKIGQVSGRLRTIKTKHLAGTKTKEAEYRENGCTFKFNVEKCYFSPRLSEERKRLMQECKPEEKILVMFGGVAPYAIIIAKNKKEIKKIVSVELGKECNKYAKINVKKNKVEGKVEIIPGDVKKVMPKLAKKKEYYQRIIMARPNLQDSFIKYALMVAKKDAVIHYHGFSHEEEKEKMVLELMKEIREEGREAEIISVIKVGDIAPRKYRWRINIKIKN
ncbi:MAG: hypothetical protein AABW73_04885 [Nanoarchaeota archaeon]